MSSPFEGISDDRTAVIIVNFNGGSLLLNCIRSVCHQSRRPDRVIVVDNASTDGSAAVAESSFPDVEFLLLDRNIGFAAANNHAAILAEDCQWIALLNPDAYVSPDWLERMLAAAGAYPEAGAFGCRVYRSDDPSLLDGMGDVYHISGRVWRSGHGRTLPQNSAGPSEIFSPCAAAALYRREAFLSVDGFDEAFFCYLEDIDLGFRLRLAGYRCMLVPDAVAYHAGSVMTGGQHGDFAVYHGHRNLVWAYVKNMPGALFWLFLPIHLLLNLVSAVWFSLQGKGGIILKAKRDALIGIPGMLIKRRRIQKGRVASVADIWRVLDKRLLPLGSKIREMSL